MNTIDLHQLEPGAAVEIGESMVFPVLQRGTKHAYLCGDNELRVITIDGGAQLLGGSSAQELADRLTRLGFRPTIIE